MTEYVWGGPFEPPAPGTKAYLKQRLDEVPDRYVSLVGKVVAHQDDIGPNDVTIEHLDGTLLHLRTDEIMIEQQ